MSRALRDGKTEIRDPQAPERSYSEYSKTQTDLAGAGTVDGALGGTGPRSPT